MAPRRNPAKRFRVEATSNDTGFILHLCDMKNCVMRQGANAPSKLNIITFCNLGLVNTEPALDQAFGLLVSVSYTHYCASTSDLSTI